MKKVISITLNGLIFMIEEDAMQKLSAYLDSIKVHYGADGKEITDDIEANIAEKFKAKNQNGQRPIGINDVEEVIHVMGTINQMEEAGEPDEEADSQKAERKTEQKKAKRLYRDNETAIIGGVCSGLAAYFSIDVVIVRLIFVALVFANGFGIIVYLLMWLIVPQAKTSLEKLEMHGEAINLKNIEEIVKEKSEQLKENSQKAYAGLKEKKPVIIKILSFPIVLIEALINFIKSSVKIILPILRYGFGSLLLIGVFFTFIFSSFWAVIFLFKNDSRFLQTDFPIEAIINSKEFLISVVSLYFIGLIFMVFAFILAISLIGKKRFFNLKIVSTLIALLVVGITTFSVYCFEVAGTVKLTYDKYLSENMVEKPIDLEGFNAISGEMRGSIKIEKADYFSVSLKGLKKDVENIEFTREAELDSEIINLKIGRKNKSINNGVFNIYEPLELIIKMPELKKLDPSGFWGYNLTGFENREKIIIEDYSFGREKRENLIREDPCELNAEYWCEAKQRCIKPWMEVCDSDINFETSGRVAIESNANATILYIVYSDEEENEKRSEMKFDERSICGGFGNNIVCMALSVSDYGLNEGARIMLRGEKLDDKILVRELVNFE